MMTELPVRLNAGDKAPEDCVAVPLHGPGDAAGHHASTWEEIASMMSEAEMPDTANALEVIVKTAEADRPLREGDRVRVGFEGTITSQTDDDSYVVSTHFDTGPSSWWETMDIPRVNVTRIGDPASSASPLRITHEDGASDVTALRDEDNPEGAGGSQDPGPTPDWTPTDGMLVERISDGQCFRLARNTGQVSNWIKWILKGTNPTTIWAYVQGDDVLHNKTRPRYLREGDVIEKVEWDCDCEHPHHLSGITWMEPRPDGGWYAHVGGYLIMSPRTIHVEGLGPVPWPPKEKP